MLHPGGRICYYLTMQLKSWISIVSGVYLSRWPMWQQSLSTELLGSGSCVRSNSGHFVEMTTILRVPIAVVAGGYHLEPAVPDEWFVFAGVTTDWTQTKASSDQSMIWIHRRRPEWWNTLSWSTRLMAHGNVVGLRPTIWRQRVGTPGEQVLFMAKLVLTRNCRWSEQTWARQSSLSVSANCPSWALTVAVTTILRSIRDNSR